MRDDNCASERPVTISTKSTAISVDIKGRQGTEMTKLIINDAATARAQYAALAGHYRAIGSAAIRAALVCMPKKAVKNPTVAIAKG